MTLKSDGDSYLGDFKVKEYVNPAIMTSPTAEIISEPKQPAAFWEPRLIIHASDSYRASLLTPYELSCIGILLST